MHRGIVGPFKVIPIPFASVFDDICGRRFGMLQVRGYVGRSTANYPLWLCDCDCGNFAVGRAHNLKRGTQSNCGCVLREKNRRLNTTHGQGSPKSRTVEYKTWLSMRERCFNSDIPNFQYYGGRGIGICERWDIGEGGQGGFACFFADMGTRPSDKHSIDRIDNDVGYEPTNCRWATAAEQIANRRSSTVILIDGARRRLSDVCREKGLNPKIVYNRLNRGENPDRALRPIKRRAA